MPSPPLTGGQRGLWFLDRLAPGGRAYHLAAAFRLHGAVGDGEVREAFRRLLDRHEALRTTFPSEGGGPVARVAGSAELAWRRHDAAGWSETALARALEEAAYRLFDLEGGPLLRVELFVRGAERSLVVSLHHMVADFASLALLLEDLRAAWSGADSLAPAPPFSRFAAWHEARLAGEEGEALWRFWRSELAGLGEALDLPFAPPTPSPQGPGRAGCRRLELWGEVPERLEALSRGQGGTEFAALLAGFAALLGRYAGVTEVPIGVPTFGRPAAFAEAGETVGYFVNPVVLRLEAPGEAAFSAVLSQARRKVFRALKHQEMPLPVLLERLRREGQGVETPFRAVLVYHRAPAGWPDLPSVALGERGGRLSLGAVELETLPLDPHSAQFDLVLHVGRRRGGLGVALHHALDRIDTVSAERLLGHWAALLGAAAAAPGTPLEALPLLSAAERHQAVLEANDRPEEEPADHLLAGFWRRAARAPDAVAVEAGLEALTYGELATRALHLAGVLARRGVGPEVVVGVHLPRRPELVLALLGVLWAGGAYLPLDPNYPEERLARMLEDAGARLVIGGGGGPHPWPLSRNGRGEPGEAEAFTTGPLVGAGLGAWGSRATCPGGGDLQVLDLFELLQERAAPPSSLGSFRSFLSYLVFTSGSTGRPKGVALTHGNAVRLLSWAAGAYPRQAFARVLAATSVGFDMSVFEIFATLAAGGTIVLAGSPLDLPALPQGEAITLINTVPAAAAALLDLAPLPASLRAVNLGGEPLRRALVDRLQAAGVPPVWNLYGPSEDTTYSTGAVIPPGSGEPPLGRPVAGSRAYVLDRGMAPLPFGVPGEIFLGGESLARGYFGRPDLTAERFVPDPVTGSPGARLYRTGDLGRWRSDGQLDGLGRLDRQVKIRGFRVEPGEVEAVLGAHPAVREAAVVFLPEAGSLAAFFVASEGAEDGLQAVLEAWLARRLPAPFLPGIWLRLEALPLSPNGKIDRALLARSASGAAPAGGGFEPPRGATEKRLTTLWEELLGRGPVGRTSRFFDHGGHSLLAARAKARIREELGADLPLRFLLEASTLAEWAARIDSVGGGGAAAGPIPRQGGGPAPATFAQARLWFLHRLHPGSAAYHLPLALRLEGEVDRGALVGALAEMVHRHESLRTVFAPGEGGVPVQVVLAAEAGGSVRVDGIDLSGLPGAEREAEVRQVLTTLARMPFDLARGPVLRSAWVISSPRLGYLSLTVHHIAADGESLALFLSELAELYAAFRQGRPSSLLPLPLALSDYARWQRRRLDEGALEADLGFWRGELAGLPGAPALPADQPQPRGHTGRGGSVPVKLDRGLTAAVTDLARAEGGTPFMVILAGWAAFLARVSGADDLAVGVPWSGRDRPELVPLVGFLVNTLPLRLQLPGDPTGAALVRAARRVALSAHDHAEVPFERLVEELAAGRVGGDNPFFRTLLAFTPAPPRPRWPGLEVAVEGVETGDAKLDLLLDLTEENGEIAGRLEFVADFFDRATAERLAGGFLRLLEGMAARPESPLSALTLLSGEERRQLAEWNDTALPRPSEATIPRLFLRQVAEVPDRVAVEADEGALSYAELAARAGELADRLVERGGGPEKVVSVCLERSLAQVVAFYGVMLSGAAYLPLDPEDPPARGERLAAGAVVVLRDEERTQRTARTQRTTEGAAPWPEQSAYVIYTSGSTGEPKGVVNTHGAIANRLLWMQEAYPLGADDRVLQKTPATFDVSVWEYFWPLMSGARLVVARPGGHRDPDYLAAVLAEREITTVHFVPSMLAVFLDRLERHASSSSFGSLQSFGSFPALRRVLTSGEALPPSLAERFFTLLPETPLHNLYGPTEAAVDVTAWPVSPGDTEIPIGRPIANVTLLVLDRLGGVAPVGVAGELLLGGVALARGYRGRPDLTAERFVPHPEPATPGERLYRTGDLASFRADGAVRYLGRIDRQVKVRGQRVEPGEIEAVLARHPALAECAVVVRGKGAGARLVAYVAPSSEVEEEALREFLAARLAAFLVPSQWVFLAEMPKTSSGKLDRKALPEPVPSPLSGGTGDRPASPVEEVVAGIWSEVLGAPEVGAGQSFFDLGGHSLLATLALSRLEDALPGVPLSLRDLFEAPTPRELAARIEARGPHPRPLSRDGRGAPPPDPGRRGRGASPSPVSGEGGRGGEGLPPAQARMWVLEHLSREVSAYHIAGELRFSGSLSPAALAAALGEVVRRHEALRTVFPEADGVPRAIVLPEREVSLPLADLAALPVARRREEGDRLARATAIRCFDLAHGPLARFLLLRTGVSEHRLAVVLHHIAADGWSLGVLAREVGILYRAFAAGLPSPLPELAVQYGEAARRLAARGDEASLAHFAGRLAGLGPLGLPSDRPRPAVASLRGGTVAVAVSPETGARVRALARTAQATPFMVLAAAVAALLARLSGDERFALGTVVAGRDRPETEPLIGLFVNTLALAVDASESPVFSVLLSRLAAETFAAFAHRALPFERLVEALAPDRSLPFPPVVQALFVLQNTPRLDIALPGLEVEQQAIDTGVSRLDLTLALVEDEGGGLSGSLEYAADLFDRPTALRWAEAFSRLLAAVVADPDLPLGGLPVAGEAERHLLALEFAEPEPELPSEGLLHRAFEVQAARFPDLVAIDSDGAVLTYGEVASRAGYLATHLRALGLPPEGRVAVSLCRSPRVVLAMLGIWKAGGVYLPLDPALPEARRSFVLTDAEVHLALSDTPGGPSALDIAAFLSAPPAPAPAPRVLAEQLAYVIYTSGSTGEPKGVAVSHREAVRHLAGVGGIYRSQPGMRLLQFFSFFFDPSIEQVAATLSGGGTLVLRGDSVPDPASFLDEVERLGITLAGLPTPFWAEWVRAMGEGEARPGLRLERAIAGGEAMAAEVARTWSRTPARNAVLGNGYGPTEAVISAAFWLAPPGGPVPDPVPIGRALPGRFAVVATAAGEPQPLGVHGELLLGGPLARGYLGRPGQTAERFRPDPFSGLAGTRLYATGDRARFLPDGSLQFFGRLDRQVKVRGFRIEPGEIEAALAEHPGVRQIAVTPRRSPLGEVFLAAWVAAPGVSQAELARFAAARLPAPQVPAVFAMLPELPQTAQGKLDRRALAALPLPEPEGADRDGGGNEIERTVAALWADLLGAEVGAADDFFALGGHSLLAVRAASRLSAAFGVEVALADLLSRPTVSALAEWLSERLAGGARPADPIPAVPDRRDLPLSFAQSRLWFLDRLAPGQAVYNMPAAVRLTGRLDRAALGAALAAVEARHETLRTTFPEIDGEPVQRIGPTRRNLLPLSDLSALPAAAREREAVRLEERLATLPFDLRCGPVWRTVLLALSRAEHRLLVTLHHIAGDGWSVGILMREVAALYRAAAEGGVPSLAQLPVQYGDYAAWQRSRLALWEPDLAFFRKRLAGAPALVLPADRPRPAARTPRGGAWIERAPAPLAARVDAAARRIGTTPFLVLLTAFAALLERLTGQGDLVVGTAEAGRGRPEIEGLIGFFVNTLPLRLDTAGDPAFTELASRVRGSALAVYARRDLPFDRLVEEIAPERTLAHAPLVQALFVLQDLPAPALEIPGLSVELTGEPHPPGTAKLDLSVEALREEEGYFLVFEYSRDLFEEPTVARLAGAFVRLLGGALASPEARVSDLPLLSDETRFQLGYEWNPDGWGEEGSGLAFSGFLERAEQIPHAAAVVFEDEVLTYGGLAARASELADRLRDAGAGLETVVAVSLPRSPATVVALLAVLEAGGVYLPVDPELPAVRLERLLADSGARLEVREDGVRTVALSPVPSPETGEGNPVAAVPQGLAWLLYTSGSTGEPKGVGVSHAAAASHMASIVRAYGLSPGDRVLQFAAYAFDPSLEQILATLGVGATLVLRGAGLPAPSELTDLMLRHGITVANLPTAYWEQWSRDGEIAAALPALRLRLAIPGGEALHAAAAERFLAQAAGRIGLANAYGPTEAVVTATLHPMTPGGPSSGIVPLGRPVPPRTARVLSATGDLLPPLAPGELFLGGILARGYVGRPAETAERFAPDPFSGVPGARLYRTGDRARLLPDGTLEFLGRVDRQVKVRGFRVEPGEIEAALAGLPGVAEAAVLAVGEGEERRLVAFAAPAAGAELTPAGLRPALLERLPAHLVPSAFSVLAELPKTPTGKLDRRALQPLAAAAEAPRPPGRPGRPAGELAALVAAVWAEVLGVSEVSPADSFFELGGHSLLATRAAARLTGALAIEVPVRELFEAPVLTDFAGRLERRLQGGEAPPSITPVPRGGDLPLSFAQARLWFLDQMERGNTAYNVPLLGEIEGPLSPPRLAAALGEISHRHEALRTRFAARGGEPVAVIDPPGPFPLPLADLSSLSPGPREREIAHLLAEEAARPFDLARGPLWRAALVCLEPYRHLLLSSAHHIVCDAASVRIVRRELAELYGALTPDPSPETGEGRPLPSPRMGGGLPPLPPRERGTEGVIPIQYPDYAAWQRRRAAEEGFAADLAYWRGELTPEPPVLELPADRPRPPLQTFRGDVLPFALPPALAAASLALCRRLTATPFMTFLAAFFALLSRLSGQRDLSAGTPIDGRNRAETEPLVGFFLNTLVLRADLSASPSFAALVEQVRARALAAFAHQELPFEKLVDELKPRRSLAHPPLFQALFALLHEEPGAEGVTEWTLTPLAAPQKTAKFDLSLFVEVRAASLGAGLEWNTDLFDASTAARFARAFEGLLAAAVAEPERPVAELSLLAPVEAHQLLAEWNDAPEPAGEPVAVHRLFEEQVRLDPHRPALVWAGGELSYSKLDARAELLASRLADLELPPEAPVAVLAARGVALAVALLATWKAGAAYLPLDPSYPAERLTLLLEDAGAAAVLAEEGALAALPATVAPVILLDDRGLVVREGAVPRGACAAKVRPPVDLDRLSYLIYTSGSTGRPKGVAQTQRTLANLIGWQVAARPGAVRTLQFASPSFDVSVQEVFATWAAGGALVLAPEEVRRDPDRLAPFLAELGVERLFLPYVALQGLAERLAAAPRLPALAEIVTAGEQLQITPQLSALLARLPGCRLANQYGPTEAHVVTEHLLAGDPAGWPLLPPIGRAIPGIVTHVADADLGVCPIGVPGELLLGGAGLARGYLGRPGATAERFVPDALTPGAHGGRLYRTGDLARRRADGEIEFLGRIDRQVKVRGVRIEPGEIEAALAACPGVREAAVFVRELGPAERQLGACVTAVPGAALDAAEIKRTVAARLPEALVPTTIAVVPALPRLGSGKLDRAALPALAGSLEAAAPYQAPETALETQIAAIVAKVLARERVGRQDNFFDLGAHSLLMVRLATALEEALGKPVAVLDLFRFPSVASLSAHLSTSEEEETAALRERFEQRADLRRRSSVQRRRGGRAGE